MPDRAGPARTGADSMLSVQSSESARALLEVIVAVGLIGVLLGGSGQLEQLAFRHAGTSLRVLANEAKALELWPDAFASRSCSELTQDPAPKIKECISRGVGTRPMLFVLH